jgi:Rho GTPase-activating protein 1
MDYLDLMHEVSLRAASNRMDAHNLAVVLCPNLVSGPDPIRDVAMCAVPGGPTPYDSVSIPVRSNPTPLPEGKTTLGAVIKLCIQRYYEVFDEVHDRNEAVPQPWILRGEPSSPGGASSASSGSKRFSGFLLDDDEDADDGVLVIPVGPSSFEGLAQNGVSSTFAAQQAALNASGSIPYKVRHRSNQSGGRSVHTVGEGVFGSGNGNGNGYSQTIVNKAKSMISIDNGHGAPGTSTRKGSISVGRGTTRKSSGAGVEAMSITAEGFFTPTNFAPPVPSFPGGGLYTEPESPQGL